MIVKTPDVTETLLALAEEQLVLQENPVRVMINLPPTGTVTAGVKIMVVVTTALLSAGFKSTDGWLVPRGPTITSGSLAVEAEFPPTIKLPLFTEAALNTTPVCVTVGLSNPAITTVSAADAAISVLMFSVRTLPVIEAELQLPTGLLLDTVGEVGPVNPV